MKKLLITLVTGLLLTGIITPDVMITAQAKSNTVTEQEVPTKGKTVESFVARLYRLTLERNPDREGFNYWTKNLKTKQKNGAEAAYGFFFSKEFKNKKLNDSQYVEKLYQVMLDRNSDKSGKNYWLNKLKNGMSREFVFKGFAESKEFGGICNRSRITRGTIKLTGNRDKNEGVTGFVNRNYTKILGRNGEASGLNYWTGQIVSASNQKQKAAEVAYGFFNSKEFKNKNTSNEEFVKICYRQFLDREAEKGGLKYWLCILSKSNRDNVIAGIAQSKEFNDLMNKYKLTGSVSLNHNNCNGACSGTSSSSTQKPTPSPVPSSEINSQKNKENFIRYLYNGLLNRQPTKTEMSYIAQNFNYGDLMVKAIICDKKFAKKNLGDGDYIELLYKVLIGRKPTPDEKFKYARAAINYHRDNSVLTWLLDMSEFKNLCSKYGIKSANLHTEMMQGPIIEYGKPNPSSSVYVLNKNVFKEKNTFASDKGAQDWVKHCYKEILNRNPSDKEMTSWVNKLKNGSANMRTMIVDMLHSEEFIKRYVSNYEYTRVVTKLCYYFEYDNEMSIEKFSYDLNEKRNTHTRDGILDKFLNQMVNVDEYSLFYEVNESFLTR